MNKIKRIGQGSLAAGIANIAGRSMCVVGGLIFAYGTWTALTQPELHELPHYEFHQKAEELQNMRRRDRRVVERTFQKAGSGGRQLAGQLARSGRTSLLDGALHRPESKFRSGSPATTTFALRCRRRSRSRAGYSAAGSVPSDRSRCLSAR